MRGFSSIILFATVLLISLSCNDNKSSNIPLTSADWTIIYYADGNSTTDFNHTVKIIQDLENTGSTEKVQVIAAMSSPQTGYNLRYYHINHIPGEIGDNISSPVLSQIGGVDISDAGTLAEFIDFCIADYPASHYAVILSCNAAGWQGACIDDIHGSGDKKMSLSEMANTFESTIASNGIGKFDIIFYNSQSMASVEIAYELRNSANYFIASQLNEMLYNLPCGSLWLDNLIANSEIDGGQLALDMAEAVYNTASSRQADCQISVIDLSNSGQLASRIANFGNSLDLLNQTEWDEVFTAWTSAYFSPLVNTACIDLRQFPIELENQPHLRERSSLMDACDSLLLAIDRTVFYSESNLISIPGRYPGGLNIYMPYQEIDYDSTNYGAIDFHNTNWSAAISRLIESLASNPGYTLNISADPPGAGSWLVEPLRDHYQTGDTVLISASPSDSYRFSSWLIQDEYFYTKMVELIFGNTAIHAIANFELPPSDSTVTISGKVWWPGHNLSSNTYVFADSISNDQLFLCSQAHVNISDSSYTMVIQNFRVAHGIKIEAQDDVNNSGLWNEIDIGDGWWYYDLNNNGLWDDLITLSPGQSIFGVNIVLRDYIPKRK